MKKKEDPKKCVPPAPIPVARHPWTAPHIQEQIRRAAEEEEERQRRLPEDQRGLDFETLRLQARQERIRRQEEQRLEEQERIREAAEILRLQGLQERIWRHEEERRRDQERLAATPEHQRMVEEAAQELRRAHTNRRIFLYARHFHSHPVYPSDSDSLGDYDEEEH